MLYDLFKKVVFNWLNIIADGTNKEAVEKLLTPEGISYTFHLPIKTSKSLFKNWQKQRSAGEAIEKLK